MKETKNQKKQRKKSMVDSGEYVEMLDGKLKKNNFGSKCEKKFYVDFRKRYSGTILRRGCPDFFVKVKGKVPFFVEVKSKRDSLSKYQKAFRSMLFELGVKVFTSKNGKVTKEIENHLS